jgi:Ice-binding-like
MTIRHAQHRRAPVRLRPRRALIGATALGSALLLIGVVMSSTPAFAAGPGLASAAAYSVLGGSTVTNTGSSVLSGDLGVSPGTAITGFSTATVGGATHAGDAQAAQAQADLTAAYTTTAGLTPTQTSLGSALVGGVHDPGVYNASSALDLSGAVTLDGQGDPNSVFVFQVGAGFTTASSASILLIGAAQACNVFWQVGTSATLGTNTTFVGTIMALTSITLDTGATVQGRALARNGAVTLDDNVFTTPGCATTVTTTPATSTPSTPASTATTAAGTSPTVAATSAGAAGSAGALGAATSAASAAAQRAAIQARAGSTTGTTSTTLLASTGVPGLTLLLLTSATLIAVGGGLFATGLGHHRPRRVRPAHRP